MQVAPWQAGIYTSHKANEVQPRIVVICKQDASEGLTDFRLTITLQMPFLKQTVFLELHNKGMLASFSPRISRASYLWL